MNAETPMLPATFIKAVAATAKAGSAGAHLAADHARRMLPGHERANLLHVLLSGPNKTSAPEWMLEAAARDGLNEADYLYRSERFQLCIKALTHPACSAQLVDSVLRGCNEVKLARIGQSDQPAALASAAAEELLRRSSGPQPLKNGARTPAQNVLRMGSLSDMMFDAAISLLPTKPDDEQDRSSWRDMWTTILLSHPERHKQLMDSGSAHDQIRRCLISDLPWKVEARLLRKLAREDLAQFDAHVVVARACRMRRDGASSTAVRNRFAAEIAALDDTLRQYLDSCLEDRSGRLRLGCQAAATWVSKAVREEWRYILHPNEAKSGLGKPEEWSASPEDVAQIASMFAHRTLIALEMWEPNPRLPVSEPWELAWAIEVLKQLTWVSARAKTAVDALIANAEIGRRISIEKSKRSHDSLRQFDRALRDLENLAVESSQTISDPDLPTEGPEIVTVRRLAALRHEQLLSYLQLHPGIDDLEPYS